MVQGGSRARGVLESERGWERRKKELEKGVVMGKWEELDDEWGGGAGEETKGRGGKDSRRCCLKRC